MYHTLVLTRAQIRETRTGGQASLSFSQLFFSSLFDSFTMMPILQMNLEIVHTKGNVGRVELSRAIFASDAWVVTVFCVRRRRHIRLQCKRLVRIRRYGSVAHRTLKEVIRILGLQIR